MTPEQKNKRVAEILGVLPDFDDGLDEIPNYRANGVEV